MKEVSGDVALEGCGEESSMSCVVAQYEKASPYQTLEPPICEP